MCKVCKICAFMGGGKGEMGVVNLSFFKVFETIGWHGEGLICYHDVHSYCFFCVHFGMNIFSLFITL